MESLPRMTVGGERAEHRPNRRSGGRDKVRFLQCVGGTANGQTGVGR